MTTTLEVAEQLADELYGLHCDIGRLEVENARLRKLVKMMWLACKRYGIVGGTYAYPDRNSNVDEQVRFEPLLRELGLEVDG